MSVRNLAAMLVCIAALCVAGCGDAGTLELQTPEGAIVGRGGWWNYSPSVILEGDVLKVWWCGTGINPADDSQVSDTILYETVNTVTHEKSKPTIVLAETKGSWDAKYTCNPRVIRGSFVDPLGDGETYTYEMFYVGTVNDYGNAIGAAFSNDGIAWKKYPEPVIHATSQANFGVGQPAAYNRDGRSGITLFYEDFTPTVHHVEATSTDGIHFTVEGTLTNNGLEPWYSEPLWADIGFDPATNYWYAAFNLPTRDPKTTGGIGERGQYGFELYRISASSLLTGTTPWQLLKTVDTNLTGYESNFLPSLLHDGYGSIHTGSYPVLQLFTSVAIPRPAWNATPEEAGKSGDVFRWAIAVNTYDPAQNTVALKRYRNAQTYEVTTGWADPIKFFPYGTLGHLYTSPQNGATLAFYGCKQDEMGYFVSLKHSCDGQRILGVNGYGYASPPKGIATVPLYSCRSAQYGQFVSQDPECERNGTGTLLGYALP